MVNHPGDLVAQLSIMDRLNEFGGKSNFLLNYTSGDKEASNLEELSKTLYSRCLIRREKKKVLPQLPEKTRVDLYAVVGESQRTARYVGDRKSVV